MSTSGRNQPCPCGSGRQFERVLRARRASRARWPRAARATPRSPSSSTFAFHPAFDSDQSIAEVDVLGQPDPRRRRRPSSQWLLDSEDATIKYNTWFLFDWEVDGLRHRRRALPRKRPTPALTPAEREFLRRLATRRCGSTRSNRSSAEQGVHLLDLWTGERLFVIERTATEQMVTWDLLGARVAPDGIGRQRLRRRARISIRPSRRTRSSGTSAGCTAGTTASFRSTTCDTFFRKHGMVFHHLWLNLVAFPEPPQLVTADGDPLVFCRSVFETDEPDGDPRRTGGTAAGPRRQRTDSSSWREADGARRARARDLVDRGQSVVFETNSQERAARGRAWLEALFGDRVRYRATALETLEQTMNELRSRPAEVPAPLEPRSCRRTSDGAVRELFDRHYHAWLDRPLPALGNRTPRAAARSRAVAAQGHRPAEAARERDRARRAARPAAPTTSSWIWRELGLTGRARSKSSFQFPVASSRFPV